MGVHTPRARRAVAAKRATASQRAGAEAGRGLERLPGQPGPSPHRHLHHRACAAAINSVRPSSPPSMQKQPRSTDDGAPRHPLARVRNAGRGRFDQHGTVYVGADAIGRRAGGRPDATARSVPSRAASKATSCSAGMSDCPACGRRRPTPCRWATAARQRPGARCRPARRTRRFQVLRSGVSCRRRQRRAR